MSTSKVSKVVVAYSGGLDTSVIVRWLLEERADEVIAFCSDVGQGDDLEAVKQKAIQTGASKCIVFDQRADFVSEFVMPAIRGHAVYEGLYLLGTAIARPIIARGLVEVARQEGAEAICHGATGKGNDQVRFEQSAFALEPEIRVISPWREWSFEGRSDLIEYARQHQIPVEATAEKPYSVDQNLLHISYEGGILEDPWQAPPADMFRMSTDPMLAPDQPQEVEISFEAGLPVAVDGEALEPMALLQKLNQIAGAHGVGRIDIVENRAVGLKSRGVYETPGGTVLHLALRAVESMALDREQIRLLDDLAPRFATMIYDGFWFAPEREALSAMVDEIQKHTTGVARIRLYKGAAMITGRKAQRSLYDARLASFESDQGAYNQADAEGFIKLRSLRLRTRALQERKL